MTLQQLTERFPRPWQVIDGRLTVLICDAKEELLCVIEPAMDRDDQLEIADTICRAINGPMLPAGFHREAYSGRVQMADRWNAEHEETLCREFVSIDPADELG